MKLISCDIEGFGCLVDRHFDFDGGFNSFVEENGYGKTTLAAFIKAMFYALPTTKVSKNDLWDERRHFVPDKTGLFGGSLVFESKGKEYRIVRHFDKKSAAKDELQIMDNASGAILSLGQDSPGQYFFGIDEQSFLRTAYVSDILSDVGTSTDINRRMHNIEDDLSSDAFQKAQGVLEKYEAELKPKRKSVVNPGKIYRLNEELHNRQSELAQKEALLPKIEAKYKESGTLQAKLSELLKAIDEESARGKIEALWQNYDHRLEELSSKEHALKTLKDKYPLGLPSLQELNEASTKLRAHGENKSKIESLSKVLKHEEKKEIKPDNSLKKRVLMLALLLILVSNALLLCGLSTVYWLSAAILAIAALVAYFCIPLKKPYFETYVVESQEVADEISVCRQSNEELAKALNVFLQTYGFLLSSASEGDYSAYSGKIENVRYDLGLISRLENELVNVRSGVEKFRTDNNLVTRPELMSDGKSLEELKNEKNLTLRTKTLVEREIDSMEEEIGKIPQIERSIEELREQIDIYSHKLTVVQSVLHYLSAAEKARMEKFVEPVKTSYTKLVGDIESSLGEDVRMDYDYSMKIGKDAVDPRRLSDGQKACMNLCLRLSILKHFAGDSPFLILDDPLMEMDEKHILKTANLLKSLSESVQIIYFSCHGSRKLEMIN